MKDNVYKCGACGDVFESEWTPEDALAESEALFGKLTPDERDIVCEDCFRKMMPNKA